MNKLIIILGLVLAFVAMAIPVLSYDNIPVYCDELDACVYNGAYIECTGAMVCDAFGNIPEDGMSIYIHNAQITTTGASVKSGSDGNPGTFFLGVFPGIDKKRLNYIIRTIDNFLKGMK